ncbi:MAG TPA: redoxin domain-containing protein [Planctomycetota bacterium]|nr:redoxin domain-containing protein [Planctomycetota bacterium]
MYPHERSLVKDYEDKPFAIIGINSDKDLDKLKPRLEAENITWRSFWNGPDGTQGPISKAWHVSGWPTVYVIDHEGILRYKGHGDDKRMDKVLRACIEAASAAKR